MQRYQPHFQYLLFITRLRLGLLWYSGPISKAKGFLLQHSLGLHLQN